MFMLQIYLIQVIKAIVHLIGKGSLHYQQSSKLGLLSEKHDFIFKFKWIG